MCNLNKGCGYGCQVHHVAYCMIVAYATQRTLILESKGWRYARGGWETVFQPLSEVCTTRSGEETIRWQGESLIQQLPQYYLHFKVKGMQQTPLSCFEIYPIINLNIVQVFHMTSISNQIVNWCYLVSLH